MKPGSEAVKKHSLRAGFCFFLLYLLTIGRRHVHFLRWYVHLLSDYLLWCLPCNRHIFRAFSVLYLWPDLFCMGNLYFQLRSVGSKSYMAGRPCPLMTPSLFNCWMRRTSEPYSLAMIEAGCKFCLSAMSFASLI